MHPVVHHVHRRAKRHFEERYVKPHGPWAHIVLTIDGLLVSAILVLLGVGAYFAFVYSPLRDDFRVGLEGAETLAGGEAATLAVTLTNEAKEGLKDAQVDIFPPAGFPVMSTLSEDDRIDIGTLPSGLSMRFFLRGVPLGDAEGQRLIVRVRATGETTGERDERFAAFPLSWTENRLALEWDLPETVVLGQPTPFTLRFRNGSDLDLEDIEVVPSWPEGFRLALASPPADRGAYRLPSLGRGETAAFEFVGVFAGEEGARPAVSAEARWTLRGRALVVARAAAETGVFETGLRLSAAILDAPYAVPGEELAVRIRYANEGARAITGLRLRLPLDARFIDAALSRAEEGGRSEGALVWEPVTMPPLERLEPGASGEAVARVRILRNVSRFAKDASLVLAPEAAYGIEGTGLANARASGARAETKVAGAAELSAAARYYSNEGDQIGRGPLPPRVGQTTRYWLALKIDTGAADTRLGRVVLDLAPGVEWTGRAAVTAGLEPELQNGRLVWNIGDIAAHAGTAHAPPNASFELSLTPSAAMLGTMPPLILSGTFTGADAWTSRELRSAVGAITTALPTDPFLEGRSVVRP